MLVIFFVAFHSIRLSKFYVCCRRIDKLIRLSYFLGYAHGLANTSSLHVFFFILFSIFIKLETRDWVKRVNFSSQIYLFILKYQYNIFFYLRFVYNK